MRTVLVQYVYSTGGTVQNEYRRRYQVPVRDATSPRALLPLPFSSSLFCGSSFSTVMVDNRQSTIDDFESPRALDFQMVRLNISG